MDLSPLEMWGYVSLVIISSLAGYALGASLKQFYEGRVEPKWLTTLCIVLATASACGGIALATWWAVNT